MTDEQKNALLAKAERLAGKTIESEPVWQVRCQACGWETLHIGMGYRVIERRGHETRVAPVDCHCGGTLVLIECVYKPTKESVSEP